MNVRTRDLLGSIFMLVFVISLWMQRDFSSPFGAIFPDVWLFILAGLAVVTIALAYTPWSALKDDVEKTKSSGGHWFDMAVVGVILLAWTILLRHIGFIATGLIGFTAISWFLNDRRNTIKGFIESTVVGAGMVGLLLLVFEILLKVPLPKGFIFN